MRQWAWMVVVWMGTTACGEATERLPPPSTCNDGEGGSGPEDPCEHVDLYAHTGSAQPSKCPCIQEAERTVVAIARLAGRRPKGEPYCESASPIPTSVLKGRLYWPWNMPGTDFNSGDESRGWRCIGFLTEVPIQCQYRYSRGEDAIGPFVGGPDPGPDGFEAAARCDCDGDGVIATYTVAGVRDVTTGLTAYYDMFRHQPGE